MSWDHLADTWRTALVGSLCPGDIWRTLGVHGDTWRTIASLLDLKRKLLHLIPVLGHIPPCRVIRDTQPAIL